MRNEALYALTLEHGKASLTYEAQASMDNHDIALIGLGVMIASHYDWDISRIVKVCAIALEDANAHTEAAYLYDLVEKWENGEDEDEDEDDAE